MDSEPLDGSRRVMLGLVLMAVLLMAFLYWLWKTS